MTVEDDRRHRAPDPRAAATARPRRRCQVVRRRLPDLRDQTPDAEAAELEGVDSGERHQRLTALDVVSRPVFISRKDEREAEEVAVGVLPAHEAKRNEG